MLVECSVVGVFLAADVAFEGGDTDASIAVVHFKLNKLILNDQNNN